MGIEWDVQQVIGGMVGVYKILAIIFFNRTWTNYPWKYLGWWRQCAVPGFQTLILHYNYFEHQDQFFERQVPVWPSTFNANELLYTATSQFKGKLHCVFQYCVCSELFVAKYILKRLSPHCACVPFHLFNIAFHFIRFEMLHWMVISESNALYSCSVVAIRSLFVIENMFLM